MNEQEAMKILDELATFEYVQIENGDTAIETIKYYVKKLEEEINDLKWKNEIYVKSIKSHKSEIEKKDMIINLILEKQAGSSCLNIYCKKRNKKDKCLDCVKIYYENRVEKENENNDCSSKNI